MEIAGYDPFVRGHFLVGAFAFEAPDRGRARVFPCEIWYPARAPGVDLGPGMDRVPGADPVPGSGSGRDAAPLPGAHPLIVFSHHSGGHRRSATFLCEHLASHGYVVAALNHSEVVAGELAPRSGETPPQRAARIDAVIASRVPDVRFLLDFLLSHRPGLPSGTGNGGTGNGGTGNGGTGNGGTGNVRTGNAGGDVADGIVADGAVAVIAAIELDLDRIGLVGHSFGGWTALATPEVDRRVRAVVAMGPGGSSRPRPGILPLTLTFAWHRPVSTLYLAAADDTPIPLDGVRELFGLTPEPKRMFVLQRADHQHFIDDVETEHEAVRAMSFPGEASWIPAAMRPISELCSGEQAHLFVRGLTLAHLDAALRGSGAAERFLDQADTELAARDVEAVA